MNVIAGATEPKQSEEALGESEAMFRLLFEKSPDAMLLLDGDVFVDCNQAAMQMMRCSSVEQLLALHPYDISPERQPDGRLSIEEVHDLIAAAFREGSLRFEWVHRAVDGTDFPVEVLLTALSLCGRKVLHVVWRDIAERKRAEEKLWEKEAQYRGIFESTSDCLLILDFDGRIVEANPAACRMYGYSYEELIGLSGKDIIHSDYHQVFEDFRRQVRASGRFGAQSVDLRKDGSRINVEVHGASFSYKGKPHLLAVVRDVTERVLGRQMLEQRVEERTRELSTLLEVSRNMASTLESQPLLGLILDQLKGVVDYSGATILALEGDVREPQSNNGLVVLAYRGPIPQEEVSQLRFPLPSAPVNREVIRRREPVIIPDVRGDTPLARAFRETAGERAETTFGYVRSWMGVPLMVKDQVIGMLTLDHSEPNCYSPRQAELALAFANQAAVAVENARLYQAEQDRRAEAERRRQVAEGLRDIVTILNSNRPLTEILDCIVAQAGRLMGPDAVAIYRLQGRDGPLQVQASSGLPADFVGHVRIPVGEGVVGRAVRERRPVAFPDMTVPFPDVDGMMLGPQQALVMRLVARYRSALAVPLIVEGRVYGGIVLYYPDVQEYSDEEIGLAETFADQTALAIENARLRAQAEQSAVAAERSRLARDLHDAVIQTLFSASLIAEVLPRIWERNPDEGQRRLNELRELTRGALAEMRTLLLELRPSALVEARLTDLLHQIAESITGRARVPVAVEVEGECDLPVAVKVALYRIAHEALNNVAKHARASQATVSLHCRPPSPPSGERPGARVKLCVRDNGRGFEPESAPLGLGIMRERAEAIGAALTVESKIGHGTEIVVVWDDTEREES